PTVCCRVPAARLVLELQRTDRLGQFHPGRVNPIRRGATIAYRPSRKRAGPCLRPRQIQGERECLRPQLPAEGWRRGVPGSGNADLSGDRPTLRPRAGGTVQWQHRCVRSHGARILVAMGLTGSDVAVETAEIALLSDDLSRVPHLLEL